MQMSVPRSEQNEKLTWLANGVARSVLDLEHASRDVLVERSHRQREAYARLHGVEAPVKYYMSPLAWVLGSPLVGSADDLTPHLNGMEVSAFELAIFTGARAAVGQGNTSIRMKQRTFYCRVALPAVVCGGHAEVVVADSAGACAVLRFPLDEKDLADPEVCPSQHL